jgi:D-alanyl-D-alanine carboxypeptidase/D-alanyl-D-alanine-endopeptidase (penicillin-binding protein 4)
MYDAMKKIIFLFSIAISYHCFAQNTTLKLTQAFQQFENDAQLSNAISSLYVIDAKTGNVVFDKNSTIGLATASTLKIITAATAYELLGKDFRYKTELGYDGKIEKGVLKGNLFLEGSGDPTLGSWRYTSTKRETILKTLADQLKAKGIKKVDGNLYLDEAGFSFQPTPGGWIWDDIGNYYGAGARAINWNENQYDLILKPGKKVGDTTAVVGTNPCDVMYSLYNQIETGEKGSGDNGYIYLAPFSPFGFTEGTIPLQEKDFTISGSLPYPALAMGNEIEKSLSKNDILLGNAIKSYAEKLLNKKEWPGAAQPLYSFYSPSLDSIVYWFLKKSINLYGEALAKTLAYQKEGFGSTEKGTAIIKKFWKEKGIPVTELNIVDGSGLSPLNRVTTHAQVAILKYAKSQSWFGGYYDAFPVYNEMKMKSGTINGVKGFCGYQKSKDGNEYIFSFLVNNYNGSASSLVKKMYLVLNELK